VTVDAVLVVAFAVLAIADWVVIWRGEDRRRPITKTLATVALVVIAAVVGDMAGDARIALIVAIVLCLAGDVFLLRDDDTSFLAGLGSFALGHGAYVVTALLIGVTWPRLAWAFPFLLAVLGFQTATKMLAGARRHGGNPMLTAVAIYSAIISAMVITATGTSSWVAALGAMLFATSDSIIGYNRFVRPVDSADLPIMVTYHAGQVLLILGLIAAG
jgi:uncharacterized membrane protein YhhN